MFGFKARSISEPIADPIAAGTTIPENSVIFVMQSDASIPSNWSFINISQSDGSPSHIRSSTTVATGGQLFSRNIDASFITSSAGDHTGDSQYIVGQYNPAYSSYLYPLTYLQRGNGGAHTHSISGLNGVNAIGGKYTTSTVVKMYKLTKSTSILPNNAICFAKEIQNLDFSPLSNFHNDYNKNALLSGNLTWADTNIAANNGIYGEDISTPRKDDATSTSYDTTFDIPSAYLSYGQNPSHDHKSAAADNASFAFSGMVLYSQGLRTINSGTGTQIHTHAGANGISVSCSTAQQYLHPYKAIRDTSVYKGMILGWIGTVASSLPKGWYICNGQPVNGYTTPILNTGDLVSLTNDTNFFGVRSGGTDTAYINYKIGGSSSHSHGEDTGSTYSQNIWRVAGDNHRQYVWNHRHDGTKTITYKQGYYTLNFIIYLG